MFTSRYDDVTSSEDDDDIQMIGCSWRKQQLKHAA
jgi:hypothetical protein